MRPKAALIILDGFGYREEMKGNAIYHAGMEYYRKLWNNNPHTTLGAAGLDVGLPEGQMGNSEVGHLNLGAGRVVYQTYTKIDKSIEEGDFFKNEALLQAMENAKKHSSKLHLIGLLSDGGVHSHIRHFYALLEMAKKNGISEVYIHANLDGRDVPPACALQYIDALESKMKELNTGKIATVMGRYYGMDRDQRWERVQKAYNVMVQSSGIEAETARDAVEMGYERDETDEFVLPTVILGSLC
jgi:2,3-bisphosphoglycerate-independent phosphoglycerate mutase